MPLTLANLLTLSRIAIVPLIIAFWYWQGPYTPWILLGLYSIACISDYFDGYIAREWQQMTPFGRIMDPISDKILIVSILCLLIADATLSGLHVIAGIIIVIREITVSGLREFLSELQVSVPVTQLAKWKTAAQMVSLGILLIAPHWSIISLGDVTLYDIGLLLLWITALFTVITGYDYLRTGLRYMQDNH